MANGISRVTGRVVFGPDARPFSGATVRVQIEDVSLADAAAQILTEQVIHNISYTPDSAVEVPFALAAGRTDERRDYVVRVHVDLNGDGQIQPGDYISTESYPVLTYGRPRDLTVRVHRVA